MIPMDTARFVVRAWIIATCVSLCYGGASTIAGGASTMAASQSSSTVAAHSISTSVMTTTTTAKASPSTAHTSKITPTVQSIPSSTVKTSSSLFSSTTNKPTLSAISVNPSSTLLPTSSTKSTSVSLTSFVKLSSSTSLSSFNKSLSTTPSSSTKSLSTSALSSTKSLSASPLSSTNSVSTSIPSSVRSLSTSPSSSTKSLSASPSSSTKSLSNSPLSSTNSFPISPSSSTKSLPTNPASSSTQKPASNSSSNATTSATMTTTITAKTTTTTKTTTTKITTIQTTTTCPDVVGVNVQLLIPLTTALAQSPAFIFLSGLATSLKINSTRIQDLSTSQLPANNSLVVQFTLTAGCNPMSTEVASQMVSGVNHGTLIIDVIVNNSTEKLRPTGVYQWTDNGPCPNQTCKNGGKCSSSLPGVYYCQCTTWYYGDDCQYYNNVWYIPLVVILVVLAFLIPIPIVGVIFCSKHRRICCDMNSCSCCTTSCCGMTSCCGVTISCCGIASSCGMPDCCNTTRCCNKSSGKSTITTVTRLDGPAQGQVTVDSMRSRRTGSSREMADTFKFGNKGRMFLTNTVSSSRSLSQEGPIIGGEMETAMHNNGANLHAERGNLGTVISEGGAGVGEITYYNGGSGARPMEVGGLNREPEDGEEGFYSGGSSVNVF